MIRTSGPATFVKCLLSTSGTEFLNHDNQIGSALDTQTWQRAQTSYSIRSDSMEPVWQIWNGLEQVWNCVERGLERARIENAPTYKLGGTAAASSYTALKDHGPAIREGMGQGPACSLQKKTRGLDSRSTTPNKMKQGVWIIGLNHRSGSSGLDRSAS